VRIKEASINDVLAGCVKSNNKSKEIVYKTYYGYVLAVIIRYVSDRNDAEELVNDSFIKIFKGLYTFIYPTNLNETEKAYKGWMAKIASRTAIDFLRQKRKLFVFNDLENYSETIVETNIVTELNVKDILMLLNQLPEIQRIVFNMYEIEGFSHVEISKLLTIAESSSRVYLTRAKNKLRILYTKSLNNNYVTS